MSSTPPTPNDLTRQQLDELDALLQRMLTVPLPTPEPVPAPVAPSAWRMDPPAPLRRPFVTEEVPAREPEPVLAAAPAVFVPVTPAAAPEPFRPFPTVSLAASFPAPTVEVEPPAFPPEPVTLRGVDAPALPANFRAEPAPEPAPEPEPEPVPLVEADLSPVAEEPRPRVPLLLWPLFAANWVIETLLGLFGPLGAVLTNPVSKHVLGVLGVVLLAAAGAWAARGMGWVRFPIPR